MVGPFPSWTWALVFYLLLATVTIGWFAVSHLGSVCACDGTPDPAIYMWSLEWWPHAIAHGLNPFVTHYVWHPVGLNLAQSTAIPTAAIAMAPVTALFGPIVSYNVLAITAPALAAFTAYLLCRRLVKRELPAFVGGFLFGFSSYEFGQLLAHLVLVMTFLIPVMVLLALRRIDREISRRAYLLWMAVVFVLQLGLSAELLAESVMLGAVLLVVARFLAQQPQRARMNSLILETAAAGVIAIAVASPFLYYAVVVSFLPGNPMLSNAFGLDLANLIFPTITTWLGHHDFLPLSTTFERGNQVETNGYLSIAIVIAFSVWFFTEGRRSVLGKLLAVTIVLSIVVALGDHLHFAGVETVTLPYQWLKHVRIFDNLVPSRVMIFCSLAVSIGVAAWLAKTGGHAAGRWLLVLVGVVMLFPNVSQPLYGERFYRPKFFTTSLYRSYLTRGENVLVLPYGFLDISTLWQAETGFYFDMPEGYLGQFNPPSFENEPGVWDMFRNEAPPPRTLDAFIRRRGVRHVIVDPTKAGPWPAALARLGLRGRPVGGVLLYSVPGARA